MVLIGVISFLLGLFSLVVSVYVHSLSKKSVKGLRYYEIWKNNKESYFVIFNRSELYITRDDVYKEFFIDLRDEKAKLYKYKVRVPFAKSKVHFSNEGSKIRIDIDYIYPRSFALVEIKSSSKYYFTLEGILNNGIIKKYNYYAMRFWYHPLTRFVVAMVCCELIWLTIIFSLVFYENLDKDSNATNALHVTSFILSGIFGLIVSENYDSLKGIDANSYKKISRIIRKREREERNRRYRIRKNYILRKIRHYRRILFDKARSMLEKQKNLMSKIPAKKDDADRDL